MSGDEAPVIDEALVRRLIGTQFPAWADLPIAQVVPGGWDNATFRLGTQMSVRLPRAEGYAAQVDKEQRWLPRLAPHLPLPISEPVAIGRPAEGYPWRWSVCRWIEGAPAYEAGVSNQPEFGLALGRFLLALHALDPSSGPPPGPHNFFRGGPLTTYDAQTRGALEALGGPRGREATRVWDTALAADWEGAPTWLHGDFAPGNLLVDNGRLSAVIDFGCVGVGDPACDLAITWAFLGPEARQSLRRALPLDQATWARGRGWALWKALILFTGIVDGHPRDVADAERVLSTVLACD